MSDEDLKEFAGELSDTFSSQNRTRDSVEAPSLVTSEEGNNNNINAKMWASSGRDFFPAETAVKLLPPGQYSVKFSNTSGIYFSQRDINLDELLILPDSNSEMVLEHIKSFWQNENVFRQYGFLWKRGIMLWGPPGSGKTSTVQQLSKQIVDMGGITVYCVDPRLTSSGLDLMRRIEPSRPLVVIFEDIDAIVAEHGETDILAMLDGELQVDNVVFIATTNYPGRLDRRFINRPSRFDEIIKIGMPSPSARQFYLEHKNPRLTDEAHELAEWVGLTKDFSVAHLKELIISVECFDKSYQDAIKRLRLMMDATPDDYETSGKRKAGF